MTTYRVELGGQALIVELSERDDGLYVRVGEGEARRVAVTIARDDGELGLLVGGEGIHHRIGGKSAFRGTQSLRTCRLPKSYSYEQRR